MQLVVMAAVLAVAGAGQGCNFRCRPIGVSINVTSCAGIETVYTTMCEGQCFQEDPSYVAIDEQLKQETCNADWFYEVKHVPGCPVDITYPVARSCKCTSCNPDNMYCGRLNEDVFTCPSFGDPFVHLHI